MRKSSKKQNKPAKAVARKVPAPRPKARDRKLSHPVTATRAPARRGQPAAAAAAPALTPSQKRAIVRGCIQSCAGHSNFTPSRPLNTIVAYAECVQACVVGRIGRPIVVLDTDSENSIVAKI